MEASNIRITRNDTVNNRDFGTKAKDQAAKKNGTHSRIYFTNGDTYMGEWKNNFKHGKGTYNFQSGQQYTGEWKFDHREGYGVLSVPLIDAKKAEEHSIFHETKKKVKTVPKMKKLYTGAWENDQKHGYGTYYYADGSVYEGQWHKDLRQGWGTQHYPDGSTYEGEWHHEMRHGHGVLLLPNGDRYEGMWFDDQKEGPGKFIYLAKRQCYEGEWLAGQPKFGTIRPLTLLRGQLIESHTLPVLGLEDPDGILEQERQAIYQSRAQKLVG